MNTDNDYDVKIEAQNPHRVTLEDAQIVSELEAEIAELKEVNKEDAGTIVRLNIEVERLNGMHEYNARLVRVIDGDTIVCDIDLGFGIWLKKEHVRLARINTPEIRTKDLKEKFAGMEAKEYVIGIFEDLAYFDRYFTLKTFKNSGKYGRYIAEVLLHLSNGEVINLNDDLLDRGLAALYL
jgi:micrococcal nuclease